MFRGSCCQYLLFSSTFGETYQVRSLVTLVRQPRFLGQPRIRLITCWQTAELKAPLRFVVAEMIVPAH